MEEKKSNKFLFKLMFLLATLLLIGMVYFVAKVAYDKKSSLDAINDLSSKANDLQNNNAVVDSENAKTEEQTDYFVLYQGREIQIKPGVQSTTDMDVNEANNKKYNTTYYNYNEGRYVGESQGTFGKEETYEGQGVVNNVNKIAISKKFDAIPRQYKEIAEEMVKIDGLPTHTDLDIDEVDLDGDGTMEHIVLWEQDNKSSGFVLYDNNYNKIADLVSINHEVAQDEVFEFSDDNIEYIDLDNDGKMEVIIQLPSWEGFNYSIIKYNNGKAEGDLNYKASIEP